MPLQQHFLKQRVGVTHTPPHNLLRILDWLIRTVFMMAIGAAATYAGGAIGDNDSLEKETPLINESRLNIGECHHFRVDSTQQWNSSRISIREGEEYRISVTHVISPWEDGWVASTPEEGWSGLGEYLGFFVRFWARSPDLPMYALVCSEDGTEKSAWAVGMGVLKKVKIDVGSIACFANDWSGRYSNNHGSAIIKVCREVSDDSEKQVGQ